MYQHIYFIILNQSVIDIDKIKVKFFPVSILSVFGNIQTTEAEIWIVIRHFWSYTKIIGVVLIFFYPPGNKTAPSRYLRFYGSDNKSNNAKL